MSRKKIILLCDDTEVKGNGDGSVRELMLDPVKHYVKNLIENQQKATFFVDMAHFLFLKSMITHPMITIASLRSLRFYLRQVWMFSFIFILSGL